MSVEEFLNRANKTSERKSKGPLEEDIESEFVDGCKKLGCLAFKLVLLNRMGWPDRTVLCPGARILFVELKRKRKKVSPQQDKYRNIITGFGFTYLIVTNAQEGIMQVKQFLEEKEL